MLQLLPQNNTLTPNTFVPREAVEHINSYIDKYKCSTLDVDISFMNIPDACYVSTVCSTKHFLKYPDGKITWKVTSALVPELNKNFELGNCSYSF